MGKAQYTAIKYSIINDCYLTFLYATSFEYFWKGFAFEEGFKSKVYQT